jgi:hypothetical protein
MMYSIALQVTGTDDKGWRTSTQFPTIILDGDMLGITSVESAEKHAERMFRNLLEVHRFFHHGLRVYPVASEVD